MATTITLLCFLGLVLALQTTEGALTSVEIQTLLSSHNVARGKVNPTATNMLRMEWDDTIAAFAQEYAERCNFAHSSGNERSQATTEFSYVGENLFLTSAPSLSGSSLAQVVVSWVGENASYTFATGACSEVCGHYTQVVWASSFKLGCGVSSCSQVTNAAGFTSGTIVVCQYGPGGNINGVQPYQSGATCSMCQEESSRPFCNQGLCSSTSSGATIKAWTWAVVCLALICSFLLDAATVMTDVDTAASLNGI